MPPVSLARRASSYGANPEGCSSQRSCSPSHWSHSTSAVSGPRRIVGPVDVLGHRVDVAQVGPLVAEERLAADDVDRHRGPTTAWRASST